MNRLFTIITMILLSCNLVGQSTWFGPGYVHLNSTSNCWGDYTILNTSAIGNDDSDIILFSHVWGVAGSHEEYMLKSCGLWYTGTDWSVFDETQQLMDTNYAFNVLNANTNGAGFTHTVTSASMIENVSEIDNPALNGHPEKVFFITKTWVNGVYDTVHVGVWYDVADAKWTIYNEAGSPHTLKLNSTYNIFVPDAGTSYFQQISNDGTFYITTIDDSRLNGKENARIYVVHVYTANGGNPGYVDDDLGVWYDGSNWTIYTENYTDLFNGATFNVLIASDVITGLPEVKEESGKLKVFPNPAKDDLGILLNKKFAGENVKFRLVSMDGRTVLEKAAMGYMNGQVILDVHNLAAGLYFLYTTTSEGIVTTKVNIVK